MTDLTFAHLVDIEQIRELLEAHYKITGIGTGILDTNKNVMIAVGYHDICTRFHLAHPLTKLNCHASDAYVKAHLSECRDGHLDYRCKNGLIDVAVPIIIRGAHLATFFAGQFFYDDDKPDPEYFRNQAQEFGFDETGYLEALGRVPIFSRDRIRKIADYYQNLVRIIAGMGLKNLELSNEAAERNQAEKALLLSRFCIDKAGIGIFRTDEHGTIYDVNDYACARLGYSKDELCALSVFDIDPVITHAKMFEIKKILDASGSVTYETIHRHRDGTTFPVEITANLLEFHGKTFGISFVKDITDRKRAEEALRESETRIRRKLERILDPEGDIGELDLADIIDAQEIQALMDDLYRLTGLKMSIIDLKGEVLVDVGWQDICSKFHRAHPETRKKCLESDTELTVGVSPGEFRTYRCKNNLWHLVTPIIVGARHMGNLFMGQFFFDNEQLDYDFFRSQARRYGFPEEAYISALEAVPRQSEEYVNMGRAVFLSLTDMFSKLSYGNIKLARSLTERDRLTATLREAHDELESRVRERTRQLTSLAAELSLAEERERRRIATELHDQVGQTLILSKIKLDSLSRSLPPEHFGELTADIRKYLDQSIQDIRSLTFQLSPPLLYEVGFEAAVEWLGEEFEENYGFQVVFHDDGKKKPLDEEASVALYRMVRELLLNVAKHAKAKRVRISVGKVSGNIKIIVADDGSGFDGSNGMRRKNKGSGFGLFNIRHRIEYMGGEFKIISKINQGTSVTLLLPIKADANPTNREKP